MSRAQTPELDPAVVSGFRHGNEDAFGRISQHYFRELHIHCYRMIGSLDDADDLVQETLLRAWRNRESYEGRSSVRTWLYRIATNVCIDEIRKRSPRATTLDETSSPPYARFPWLQPYPDKLLDALATSDRPDARLERESIELAFLAAIQLLTAKQRAVLILRDVLEFSAEETARVLDDTPAAVNSALQRARGSIREHEPAPASSSDAKAGFEKLVFRQFLDFYMSALERGDIDAIVNLLRDDVRMTLLPDGLTWDGRAAVAGEFSRRIGERSEIRSLPIAANRQPAMAVYRRGAGSDEFRAWAIVVLGVVDGKLREIATFASPGLFVRFGLPPTLS